ncbi:hypothetical protein EDB84DRAFT_1469420 [Lactarius hengduanensis]|nr:hypothetical protein EDB84DRAFT_1469420 [Lactarius hengduanensis]
MSLLTFVLFYVLVFVQAVPLVKRIVVSPQITSPSASYDLESLARVLDARRRESGYPPFSPSTHSTLRSSTSLHADALPRSLLLHLVDHPLAQDILLSTGSVQITVQNVSVGSNYIAVLFGVSGNASPQFTITGGSSTTTTPSPSTSTPPSLLPTHPLSPNDISYPVFPSHLPASSHAHQHVDPWNLHHNHAHAELGHVCHECAEQLSVFVLGRNDQQCAPCSTCPWRSRDNPL